MVVLSLVALHYVNIPVYNTIRRFSTLLVIVIERLFVFLSYSFICVALSHLCLFLCSWLNKKVPMDELASVLMMVAGAVVAYMGDLTFSFEGYALTILSCVACAAYLVCIRFTKERTQSGEFEMMLYNNILSIPFVLFLVLGLELDGLLNFQHWLDISFLLCLFMSALLAFLLNYFMFLCSNVNSPLTTSVTGQVKAILSVFFGLFFFGDVIITPLLLTGLGITSVGSIYYAIIKYRQTQNELKQTLLPLSEHKKFQKMGP